MIHCSVTTLWAIMNLLWGFDSVVINIFYFIIAIKIADLNLNLWLTLYLDSNYNLLIILKPVNIELNQ